MTYVSTCLADGAVGLYELAEASGTTAIDQTGNVNAVYQNTSGITLGQPGIPGGSGVTAVRFISASNGYFTASDVAAQHFGDTFTLEVWLKLATTGVDYCLGNANNGQSWEWQITSSGTIAIWSKGWAEIGTSVASITDTTTFHHVIWTKATATSHIYIDGVVSDGTYTNQTIGNSSVWFAAFAADSPSVSLDGTLAMFAMYPTALSPTQVLTHYTAGASAPAINALVPLSVSAQLRG